MDFFKIVFFVRNLKEIFFKSNLMLTSSFFVSKDFNIEQYEFAALSKYVDFMSFMQIYVDSSAEYLSINQALQARQPLYIENNINNLIESGVPSPKIVVGIQFGGPELFTTSFAAQRASKFNGIIGYDLICKLLSNETLKLEKLNYNGLTLLKNLNEERVIIYENTRSIANQMKFLVKQKLGGVFISSISMDDYAGNCKIDEDTFIDLKLPGRFVGDFEQWSTTNYPLLRTINDAIKLLSNDITNKSQSANVSDGPINESSNQNLDQKQEKNETEIEKQTEDLGEIQTGPQDQTENQTESQTESGVEIQTSMGTQIENRTETATEVQTQSETVASNQTNQTNENNDNETGSAPKAKLFNNFVVFVVLILTLSSIL